MAKDTFTGPKFLYFYWTNASFTSLLWPKDRCGLHRLLKQRLIFSITVPRSPHRHPHLNQPGRKHRVKLTISVMKTSNLS